mmetsp:Transcript_14531/g.31118  ORF Transcript_14531/g.31118 Transcript_14531/m.31118 type:complete len:484 (+) Transcript_14531:579-2030(+)
MGEQVGVALGNVLPREGPVLQRGARVVVVYEGHRARRPQAHQTWRATLGVGQAPALVAAERLLEDRLGGEVKGGGGAAGGVAPVHRALTVGVLVVGQHTVRVVAGVPELAHREARHGRVHVLLRVLPGVPQHKVEAEAVDADGLPQPPHPLLQLGAHRLVLVVDVWRRGILVTSPRVALAAPLGCVAGDHLLVPGHAPAKLVPAAARVLPGGAAVVDDSVHHGLHVARVHLGVEVDQVLLRPVLGVQVVQVRGEVPLVRHRRGGRRQPDGGVARVRELVDAARQMMVPAHPVDALARLPVEALQEDLVPLPGAGPGAHSGGGLHEVGHGGAAERRLALHLLGRGLRHRDLLQLHLELAARRERRLHGRHAALQHGGGLQARLLLRNHLQLQRLVLRLALQLQRQLSGEALHRHQDGSGLGHLRSCELERRRRLRASGRCLRGSFVVFRLVSSCSLSAIHLAGVGSRSNPPSLSCCGNTIDSRS